MALVRLILIGVFCRTMLSIYSCPLVHDCLVSVTVQVGVDAGVDAGVGTQPLIIGPRRICLHAYSSLELLPFNKPTCQSFPISLLGVVIMATDSSMEYGKRLIPPILDSLASAEPDRIIYSVATFSDSSHAAYICAYLRKGG